MKVSVTAEHISKGVRDDGWACPLALALKDAGFETAIVGLYAMALGNYGIFNLSPEAYSFRVAFDDGKPVVPFSFEFNKEEAMSDGINDGHVRRR